MCQFEAMKIISLCLPKRSDADPACHTDVNKSALLQTLEEVIVGFKLHPWSPMLRTWPIREAAAGRAHAAARPKVAREGRRAATAAAPASAAAPAAAAPRRWAPAPSALRRAPHHPWAGTAV